jgi:hypothetical protein
MATGDGSETPSWGLLIEKYSPLLLSTVTGLTLIIFRDQICLRIASTEINVNNLYAAVLSWASIQIGFAFGVYGFVLGKTQGFIEAARRTQAMSNFMLYVRRANVGGFLLTVISLPLAVLAPRPTEVYSTSFWVVAVWFCLFVWTFFAFLRIAFIFGHLTSVPDQEKFYGA